jgi:hypothetical protein
MLLINQINDFLGVTQVATYSCYLCLILTCIVSLIASRKLFEGDILVYFLFPVLDFGIDLGFKENTEGAQENIQANYLEGKHPLNP